MRTPDAPASLRSPVVLQFIKYGLVGVANTLAYMAVYALAVAVGVWYLAASALAFAVGGTNGYLMNRSWTFRAAAGHRVTVARYAVVQVAGLLADLGLLWLLVDRLGLDKVTGQAIAIVVVVVSMFFANRYWTFAEPSGGDGRGGGGSPSSEERGASAGGQPSPAPR